MIRFSCPKCHKILKAPLNGAGRKTACPRCGERFRVPGKARTGISDPVSDLPTPRSDSKISVKCPGCGRDMQFSPDELSRTFECTRCKHRFVPFPPPAATASPSTPFDSLGEGTEPATEPGEQQDDPETGPLVETGWTARDRQIVITIGAVVAICAFAILGVGVLIATPNSSDRAEGQTNGTVFGLVCFGWCMLLIAIVLSSVIAGAWGSACPRCRRWWARTSGASELIGEKPTWKTVTRTIRHYDRRGQSAGRSEYGEQVPAVERTYRNNYSCKHCGHRWTTNTTHVS